MSRFKNLTFLKTLAVIAWADGEVTESELAIIKSFYRKFNLDKSELDELKPYLRAPLPKKEQEALFRQLLAELKTAGERKAVVRDLESIVHADKKVKEEELKLVERFSQLLGESSFSRRSLGKIRNMFRRTIFKPAREKNPERVQYFKETVIRNLEVKSGGKAGKVNLSDDEVYQICLFGSLLAAVAHVDDHFHEEEKKSLKKFLKEKNLFDDKEIKFLFDVIEEQAANGFDYHEVITEFNRLVSYNDRCGLVDCFFAIASADGDLSYEETEEIRRITKAMRVPHKTFIESKVKTLEKLRAG